MVVQAKQFINLTGMALKLITDLVGRDAEQNIFILRPPERSVTATTVNSERNKISHHITQED